MRYLSYNCENQLSGSICGREDEKKKISKQILKWFMSLCADHPPPAKGWIPTKLGIFGDIVDVVIRFKCPIGQ
jgi:hypothetical protein